MLYLELTFIGSNYILHITITEQIEHKHRYCGHRTIHISIFHISVVFEILAMVYSSHKSPAFPNVPATNQRPVIMERNPRLPSIDVWSIDEGNIIYSEWFAITTHEENRKFCTNIRFTNVRRIEEFWIFPSNWNNRFHKLCVCILQRSNYEMADIVEAMEMKLEMIKGVREVDWTIYTFTFDVSSDWLLKYIIG